VAGARAHETLIGGFLPASPRVRAAAQAGQIRITVENVFYRIFLSSGIQSCTNRNSGGNRL
jgi:hypothetical protein